MDILPWLLAMVVLIACSAFFSASEATFFSLRWADRRALSAGNRSQQLAVRLLKDPDRLLSAILFWNLMVNMTYFAIASIAGIRLKNGVGGSASSEVMLAAGSLLAIIFFSEMLPKSIAVLAARSLAGVISLPLSVAIRAVDWLLPVLRFVTLLSQRMVWPRFQPEPYLQVSDLERAIEFSTSDAKLVKQEQAVLQNIVLLSDIRADEWMRPRNQFLTFSPPVTLEQLNGELTPSGYLLISEPDSEEVAAAIQLTHLSNVPNGGLEQLARPVVVIPWCATAAEAMQQMQSKQREVAAIVNEFGETIGILTFHDILDSLFNYNPSRSRRLLDRDAISEPEPGVFHVVGMTSLRRLSRYLDMELPRGKSVTLSGVIQESLSRVATSGDECDWGPFHCRVLEAPQRGQLLVELRQREANQP